jgi:hypothetical protein
MPVDIHDAAGRLRGWLAHTRLRRRATLALAAVATVGAVAAAIVITGLVGDDDAVGPATDSSGRAEEVALGFLDAYSRFDADQALGYLADDAVVETWGNPQRLRLALAHDRALGYQQTVHDCAQQDGLSSRTTLSCAFDMHAIGSDELGLGPFPHNRWVVTVSEGEIVSVEREIAYLTSGFSDQVWEPFAAWVSTEHPDDVLSMYKDESQTGQRITQESARLWEQRIREYVAHVERTR